MNATIAELVGQLDEARAEIEGLREELNKVSGGWEARVESRRALRAELEQVKCERDLHLAHLRRVGEVVDGWDALNGFPHATAPAARVGVIEVDADSELGQRMERDGAQTGIDTPGCDCDHPGMGKGWHASNCKWVLFLDGKPGVDNPGIVDGDVLHDLLADMAPSEWRIEAAREHAEKVLAEMHRIGTTILRGPNSEPWTPARSEGGETG